MRSTKNPAGKNGPASGTKKREEGGKNNQTKKQESGTPKRGEEKIRFRIFAGNTKASASGRAFETMGHSFGTECPWVVACRAKRRTLGPKRHALNENWGN